MNQALQLLGGGCYLLNKIFLSFSERAHNRGNHVNSRRWRIASWLVYLFGLPPWVIIFLTQHNWIAGSVEAAGAPAMLLGLSIAWRGTHTKAPVWLDWLARIAAVMGFAYSLYDFGGLNTLNQWLEIGLVAGFLAGTYLLAKHHSSGYLWYVLMHVSCGWLMLVQGFWWLFVQQMVSLWFIADAWRLTRQRT